MKHGKTERRPMALHSESADVLGYAMSAVSWAQTLELVDEWAGEHQSRFACLCNAHVVMTARRNARLDTAIRQADLALPDGMPIALLMKIGKHRDQKRIAGADLMWRYCERAERSGQSIFLFGSTPHTLTELRLRLRGAFPALVIAGHYSPPFGPMSESEDRRAIEMINGSRAHTVFVGLGCPKQEIWMSEHRGLINGVMIGVGAAFDFHAGVIPRAPVWMQNVGMEWFHRLITEPRRLWRRYLITNLQFLGAIFWHGLFAKARDKRRTTDA
jgi:N-acetylglucosaminyldiphosphoundecaprenol N-acetyl-beta-D-mannosaminyltransferase